MKTLKRLAAVTVLTFTLAFATLADCLPGDMNTPPCPGAQMTSDHPVLSLEASEASMSSSTVAEISKTTIDVLLSALSIF